MVDLGAGYVEQGKLEGGIQLVKKITEAPEHVLAKDHLHRFEAVSVLGLGRFREGRIDDAIRIHTSAIPECERAFGPQHPLLLTLLSNLADELPYQGRWNEALECQEKAVEGMKGTYGADHPFTMKASQKLEELRTSMDGNTPLTRSQPDVYPRTETALHITDANWTDSRPIAAETITQKSQIVSGESVEHLASVLDHNPEPPLELVGS
jgi:Tetratricopeptide repeat